MPDPHQHKDPADAARVEAAAEDGRRVDETRVSETLSALRELDVGPEPAQSKGFGTEEAGAAVAAALVSVTSRVSSQHVQDVFRSLLLAQLAATAKADRLAEPAVWYKYHQSTLEQIGWVASQSTVFTAYSPSTVPYTITTVVTDLMESVTTAGEAELVRRTLRSFTGDSSEPAQFVWECPSHAGGKGNFQFALASEGSGGSGLMLRVGRFSFTTRKYVTRLSKERFESDARFQRSLVTLVLDERVHARLREAVAAKLGNRADGMVAGIDLVRLEDADQGRDDVRPGRM
ncbi:hypothetical protein ABZ471_43275 [Streptomyces sp. NPDC005728]|uniref:hypothetical protein n=1 Tax=Streptomyces sp. NPDC005728 TaxID=3157054 RepID=UPI0033F15BC9